MAMKDHFRNPETETLWKQHEKRNSVSRQIKSVISLLSQILHESSGYKLAALVSASTYLLLYSYSSGMFFYYSFDVTPYLKEIGLPNPQILYFRNLAGLYYSGVIWYPNSHLELVFSLGTTFFSVLLSTLFSMSILLLIYSLRFKGLSKKHQGFVGLFGLVPAIFSGGCCAVPVATMLLVSIIPSTVLFSFEFGDPFLMNLLIALLMLFSIFYTTRKIERTRNACEVCKR